MAVHDAWRVKVEPWLRLSDKATCRLSDLFQLDRLGALEGDAA
jgi:hypothetical protein